MNIYEMELHSSKMDNRLFIIRVSGGWLYRQVDHKDNAFTFVPFNNEFMEKPEIEPRSIMVPDSSALAKAMNTAHNHRVALTRIATEQLPSCDSEYIARMALEREE